jgi:hypothetical protein
MPAGDRNRGKASVPAVDGLRLLVGESDRATAARARTSLSAYVSATPPTLIAAAALRSYDPDRPG